MSESHAPSFAAINKSLDVTLSPPVPKQAVDAMIRNHITIASSTNCDPSLAAKSHKELEKFRGQPVVDQYFAAKDARDARDYEVRGF